MHVRPLNDVPEITALRIPVSDALLDAELATPRVQSHYWQKPVCVGGPVACPQAWCARIGNTGLRCAGREEHPCLNQDIIHLLNIDQVVIDSAELERRNKFYCQGKPQPDTGKTTINEGIDMSDFISDHKLIDALERQAQPLLGLDNDYDAIIQAVQDNASGNAKGKVSVLIGEATHGTAEFYRIRAEITRRLIMEVGFDAVAVEGDWLDAYRVNRYVSAQSNDSDADAALSDFERFPAWIWRNAEIHAFIKWLHHYNEVNRRDRGRRGRVKTVGFYGLDMYSMTTSIEALLAYLDKTDPNEAAVARGRYACFCEFINDPQAGGYAIASGIPASCEQEVITRLIQQLQQKTCLYVERDGDFAETEYFSAQQNAKLVKNAEEYYRAMFRGQPSTWNLRDRHMFETLERLAAHLSIQRGREARIVVWAHSIMRRPWSPHLGNAAATEMERREETNIGQLVSQKYRDRALRIGFSTSHGTVTAASNWDGSAETKTIHPPLSGSYEGVFSLLEKQRFLLDLRGKSDAADMLRNERLQRAIGVIYRPETEREKSHYFYTSLPRQFDFMFHINESEAVAPLSRPKLRQVFL